MGAIFGTRQRSTKRGERGPGVLAKVGVAAGVAAVGWLGIGWLRSGGDGAVALNTPSDALGGAPPATEPADAGSCETPAASTGPVPVELLRAFDRLDDVQALLDLRRLVKEHAGTPEATRARDALARVQAEGDHVTGEGEVALRAATRAYLATVEREARRARRAALIALADRVHFANEPSSFVTTYTVARGDSLSRVASAHRTEHGFIQRLNRMSNDRLRIGQRLKVPQAPVTVVVLKKDFEAIVLLGDCVMRVYDVATGKDGRTPEASFTIGTKLVNPDWYSPDGKVFRYGSPENILGTRWLAFENTTEHQGFGIHGTTLPETIGTESSMGCIRMRNDEVEELYDLVPRGSAVRIVR
jgi:LysM repeat protein